ALGLRARRPGRPDVPLAGQRGPDGAARPWHLAVRAPPRCGRPPRAGGGAPLDRRRCHRPDARRADLGRVTRMSRQWIAARPGGLEVFELVEPRGAAPGRGARVQTWLPSPGPGEVPVRVRAAGMNPADTKHVAQGDPAAFPRPVGYEVAGE